MKLQYRTEGGWKGKFKEGDRQRETKQGEGKERHRETISASTAYTNSILTMTGTTGVSRVKLVIKYNLWI